MPTPEELAAYGDAILPIFEAYQTALMEDIARRMAHLGVSEASVWQMRAYEEAGGVYRDAIANLARLTGQTQHTLREVFARAGAKASGASPPIGGGMREILRAGLAKTRGILTNWTMTTAVTSQQAFRDAVNGAYWQVIGGGMSHTQAIKQAIEKAAADGLTVLYPSGKADKLDVAARRAVLTGVNQTVAQLALAQAKEMDCDLVEVTAHQGARPAHAAWQGGVYRLSTGEFERVTGYGTGAGLCGWNCRHSFYPYREGVSTKTYTAAALQAMEEATVRVNGQEVPLYEATQKQRALERAVREAKRQWRALQAAGMDSGEVAGKLRQARLVLKGFEADTGLKRQAERTAVMGFGRSEATGARWEDRRAQAVVQSAQAAYNKAAKDFRQAIRSGAQKLNVIAQLQTPHLTESAVAAKSYLIGDLEDAQRLVDRFAGTGVFDRTTKGMFQPRETVKTDMPTGMAVLKNGEIFATSTFKIHYRKTGTHIVPKWEGKP